jgi:long-chain acyl-CoA synthetase
VLVTGPLYHNAPNLTSLGSLRRGATIVLQPRFDAEQTLALVERHRISHVHLVPTMFVRLLRLPEAVRRRYDTSTLGLVLHGAAPCPPEVKRAMIDWLGPVLVEYYGGTETGVVTLASSEEWLAHPGTVGKAVADGRVVVLDEQGRPLPPGEAGELFLRNGSQPDFTYRGQDDLRREIERDGLVTCGDVGYLDDEGFLFLCDRKKDMVISGGVNIYPAEIESVLIACPGVRDCAVFGIPDEEFGESLAAVIQPEDGATLAAEAVQGFLRERIAGFKVPRVIEFRADLPREDSGKIFKRKLREPYWAGMQRSI